MNMQFGKRSLPLTPDLRPPRPVEPGPLSVFKPQSHKGHKARTSSLGEKSLCPASNPPGIKSPLRALRAFVVQPLPFFLSPLMGWCIVIQHSLNTMFHQRHIPVQQISKLEFFHLEVGQKLSLIHPVK